jgi:predicted permease
MSSVAADLRAVVRQLIRRPLFVLVAVMTLGIGMGVNTVAFSVVNGVLFKGSAAAAQPNVGRIITTPGGDEEGNASFVEYERFQSATRGVLDLAAEGRSSVGWRTRGRTEPAYVLYVSATYFSMVRPQVLAGRLMVGRAAGGRPIAVVGERFWRDKLGSPALTGLTLQLNNVDVDVAGIMRESFTGPAGLYSPDLWLPLEDLGIFQASAAASARDSRWLFLLGKLEAEVNQAALQGHLDTAASLMAREWPDTHAGRGASFRLLSERNAERRGVAAASTIGMGIIGLILLLACFNVANLLLARALDRERDMGIRTALGASPARLVRLVLLEGAVLATLSGLVALLLAWWTQRLIGTFALPIDIPQQIDVSPDIRVVAFIALLVVLAGVIPGLWPAVAALRVSVTRALGAQSTTIAGGRPSRLRRGLVGAQVAGSTAFLATAALFALSYGNLLSLDVGFARDRLVVVDVDPTSHGYSADGMLRYAEQFAERLRSQPDVVSVATADRAPFFIGFDHETLIAPDSGTCDAGGCLAVPTYAVSPGFFETLGIRLIAGRDVQGTVSDEVIVNEAFGRQHWPDGGAIGRTIRLGREGRVVTVVGIARRTRMRSIDRDTPSLFVPLQRDHLRRGVAFVIRTAGAPEMALRPIADAAHDIDPDVPLLALKTMEQRMEMPLWPFRTLSLLFAVCGGLALVLSVVGLASVVAHAVRSRTREFGVRLAAGATPDDLLRDVLKGGIRLLAPGLAVGILVAVGMASLARAMFVGVDVFDPRAYLLVALVQCAVVIGACVMPARRAARVDPITALRAE